MLDRPFEEKSRRNLAARLLSDIEMWLDEDVGKARSGLHQLKGLIADISGPPEGLPAPDIVRGGLAPWGVHRITAYIETHLASAITVADLAAVVGLSNGHFCRAFKTTLGMTPHTYVIRKRLEHAQLLMLTTAEPLSQIATMAGLTDQAHLTRLFRRYVGMTPLTWRRTFRQPT